MTALPTVLPHLRALLAARQLRVMRYARVACPSRGTLLASDNLDEFLSVLTNLIGLIPGLGTSAIYQVVKRVTLEVVRSRMQPALIPGIEAMVPESPLVALLNNARKAAGALGVIAGDIEGGNWLKQLGVFVTDRFVYDARDNDLVVNITREKQLTNFRAASKDATVTLKPARRLGLEQALEYIEDDELVELTPTSIRLRKRILDEGHRKRAERQSRDKAAAKD